MEIYPAIDLREGKVVRLARGDYDRQTTYSDDPAAVARSFRQAGAGWVHVVDLDAARTGKPANTDAVKKIIAAADIKVQLGGGARSDEAVEAMLAAGVRRVVVGSAAITDWKWFEKLAARPELAGRLALGLDARDGKLAVKGWTQKVDLTAHELACRVRGWPLGAIIYTDISRDGMLGGINVRATARLVGATDVPIIASGGASSMADLEACRKAGCAGAIVGKALYEGKIDLAEAIRKTRESAGRSPETR
ncbi:MAG: 1-(5-phosphoribosyl)-5-[(5-phosphoribosylamino)methylideneamino]imidazole-4-carboxamide isomerase [Planctomycetes bacterium]|nr:1-(5-phosphoribosyl)-5-[(5-phosphoribosylamino)methylideneamino]imidazole-4-carboxamide isomerase [Planctomycetota bacterium]